MAEINRFNFGSRPIPVMVVAGKVGVVNTTPHPITFWDGEEEVVLPPSGLLLNASAKAEPLVEVVPGIVVKKTTFTGTPEGEELVASLSAAVAAAGLEPIILGSMIAAQAYDLPVVGLGPAVNGRVAPAERKYPVDQFSK